MSAMSACKHWFAVEAVSVAALVAVALLASSCTRHEDHAETPGGHAHQPKNGGQLVEVGKHQFNVEVLVDAPKGKVTAWILDAHAEDYVRIDAPALRMTAQVGNTQHEVSLDAVPNAASGEKVGDTSQFEGSAEWLKSAPAFSATFQGLAIRGTTFDAVAFQHGKAAPAK